MISEEPAVDKVGVSRESGHRSGDFKKGPMPGAPAGEAWTQPWGVGLEGTSSGHMDSSNDGPRGGLP